MATIEDLIISLEAERDQEQKDRERSLAEVKSILAAARGEGRSNVTEQEDDAVVRAEQRAEDCKTRLKGVEHRLDIAKRTKLREIENDEELNRRAGEPAALPRRGSSAPQQAGGAPAYDRVARIGQEPRTYHAGMDRNGAAFIRDVTRQFLYRDIEAESRLSRHMQEERVERGQYMERAAGDAGTGAFAGLTVPQYLTDMYAPKVAALRPFADTCNHHDLPSNGMTINISLITTATSAALQATEQTAVSATSIDDTLLTENVQTAAGQQTLSRQAIDRGTGVEEIVMDDLFRRYATTLDSTLINQATTGLAAISTAQAQATVLTTPQLYSALIQAASSVETTLLGWAQPDLVVMHPRRYYKLLSAVSSTWPMALGGDNSVPTQNLLVNNDALGYAKGIRGRLQNGMGLCVDANVSTVALAQATSGGTQDQIYVVPSQECHLWEDPAAPVFIRAEQPAAANLGVLLVLYGYFAYTFRRFSGATINLCGAGFIAPVFDGT
jgi:hypothetical protein